MKQKIKCESCNKVIAEGQTPATVIINCSHCGARNDLSADLRSFTERLGLELKNGNAAISCGLPYTEKEIQDGFRRMGNMMVKDFIQWMREEKGKVLKDGVFVDIA